MFVALIVITIRFIINIIISDTTTSFDQTFIKATISAIRRGLLLLLAYLTVK